MKYFTLLAVSSLFFMQCNVLLKKKQNSAKEPVAAEEERLIAMPAQKEDTKIFVMVEQSPMFKGGEEKLYEYINSHIKYPEKARKNKLEGTVYINFVVMKDGSITDAKVKREIGFGCGAEALRVVNNMPKWNPGHQNGHPVNVEFTLPVTFNLKK